MQAAQRHRPDLIVLDVMLPDMDGFDVIRRLRGGGTRIPVVFLTARDSTEDKIRGLTLGGDDYVTKPFSLEEVIARIRAVLRRTRGDGNDPPPRLKFADLELDEDSHEVWRRPADPAVPDGVQAAQVLHGQRQPGAVQDADTRSCLGLRLPGGYRDRGVVCIGAAAQGRHLRAALAAHPARGRLRAPASLVVGSWRADVFPAGPDGFWRALRRLPDRTSLRVKLISAVLALVAIALVVISIAGISVIKSYLLGQVDDRLRSLNAQNAVGQYLSGDPPGVSALAGVDWIRSGSGKLRQVVAYGVGAGFGDRSHMHLYPGPAVPTSSSWLAAHNGDAVTVPAASGGGRWRILCSRAPRSIPIWRHDQRHRDRRPGRERHLRDSRQAHGHRPCRQRDHPRRARRRRGGNGEGQPAPAHGDRADCPRHRHRRPDAPRARPRSAY